MLGTLFESGRPLYEEALEDTLQCLAETTPTTVDEAELLRLLPNCSK